MANFFSKHPILSIFLVIVGLSFLNVGLCFFLAGRADTEFQNSIVDDPLLKKLYDREYENNGCKNFFFKLKLKDNRVIYLVEPAREVLNVFSFFSVKFLWEFKRLTEAEKKKICENALLNAIPLRKFDLEKELSNYSFFTKCGFDLRKGLLINKYFKFYEFIMRFGKEIGVFSESKKEFGIGMENDSLQLVSDLFGHAKMADYVKTMGPCPELKELFQIFLQRHKIDLSVDDLKDVRYSD